MESNLVQPWDRMDSRKNTLNERPKRSKFLSTANLSSTTLRLELHGHVTKNGRQKQRRRPGQVTNWLQLHPNFAYASAFCPLLHLSMKETATRTSLITHAVHFQLHKVARIFRSYVHGKCSLTL